MQTLVPCERMYRSVPPVCTLCTSGRSSSLKAGLVWPAVAPPLFAVLRRSSVCCTVRVVRNKLYRGKYEKVNSACRICGNWEMETVRHVVLECKGLVRGM